MENDLRPPRIDILSAIAFAVKRILCRFFKYDASTEVKIIMVF